MKFEDQSTGNTCPQYSDFNTRQSGQNNIARNPMKPLGIF